jgi:manganese/zinc/iron transport system substrate-binding protein
MRFLLIFICGLFITSCKQTNQNEDINQIHIVATTGMIADAVKNIAGDNVTVTALMGPGVDPHLYKPTQGDLTLLRNADIIFYNGLFLEGKMQEVFAELGKSKKVYAVSTEINQSQLRQTSQHSGGSTYDPHIWFDVMLWSEAVNFIGKKLSEVDASNALSYKQNTQAYIEKLKQLDEEVKTKINSIPPENRILITSHDAFGYFGRTYGMEVRGLQGISTAAEFGLKDITDMVNTIINDKIKAVFIESSVSEKSINAVMEGCREKNHEVKLGGTLFSDAMGAEGTPEGNYIGMVRHNVNVIAEALK